MAFFARPNLDNTQFKQLKGGEPLTLSGQTQIATTSGLTLYSGTTTGGVNMYIPIVATGASNNYVLTYDSTEQVIKLKQSSASGATGIYDGASPTTCTVGGLTAGTSIYNDPVVDILQCMLVPTLYPIPIELPKVSSINLCCYGTSTLMGSICEVGCSLSIMSNTKYCGGSMTDVYSGNSTCSGGLPFEYVYNMYGVPGVTCSCTNPVAETRVGNDPPTYNTLCVGGGSNTVGVYVKYCSGATIYDSSGTYYTGVTSGCTNTKSKTICGIYPWYWGTVTCDAAPGVGRPDGDCIKKDITGGTATKVVGLSNSTLNVTFGSTACDYIWFAIPDCGGVEKTCWYVDTINNDIISGCIGGSCCLFPAYNSAICQITGVTSAQGCWAIPQVYDVYVSNYQSAASVNMQIRNS